ncbi:S9 family peptidase, partial [Mycobacterium tuberculosis]
AFGGQAVFITSSSRDGRLAMVQVWSGSNPGDFYVFDTQAKKADLVVSRSQWVDPESAAVVQPIALKARDGLPLHGFVTRAKGSEGKRLPMVVMPHGGPFFVYDDGAYDRESQLLAAAGYAVLQVNFRGSSNYGRMHAHAGGREWGGKMQDDLTDATRWAVAEGIADGAKICMYGASYGGYAALMGVAKEPSLY